MALSDKQIEQFVNDQRAFDERVVKGSIEFYNAFNTHRAGYIFDLGPLLDRCFGWIPAVMERLAELRGIEPSKVRWDNREDMAAVSAILSASGALADHIGWTADSVRKTGTVNKNGRSMTSQQWLDEVLGALTIYTRFRWTGRKVTRTSLPCLTNVQSCVAYTLALIYLNEHGLGDRVRACPFVEDETLGVGQHLFLKTKPRQTFCCPGHSNRQRQRDHYARHNKPGRASR